MSPIARTLAALLALPLAAGFGSGAHETPKSALAPIVIVAREEVADPDLRARIEALAGERPFELGVSAEPPSESAESDPRRRRITARDVDEADRPELALAVRSSSAVLLRGGDFMDWYETLFPGNGPTRLAQELRRLRRGGAPVIAYGSAAAFAAGATMIARAELDRPQRNPRDTALFTAVIGLGLGPPAIVDAEGWSVGDPLELVRALWDTKVDLGVFLEGEVALVHELEPHVMRCIGPGRALLIDLDGARRQKRAVRRGRIFDLRDGDAWSFGHERVIPSAERRAVDGAKSADSASPPLSHSAERLALGAALDAFAQAPDRIHLHLVAGQRLELRADAATSILEAPGGSRTALGVAFDLEWE